MSNNNYIRPAASYRQEARIALKGKWEAAILIGLILALIGGMMFGASINYQLLSSDSDYGLLELNLGPFTSLTLWEGGSLICDAATGLEAADSLYTPVIEAFMDSADALAFISGLVPFSSALLWAAGAVAIALLLLQPVYGWGLVRLSVYPHIARPITPALLRVSWHEYWKWVGAAFCIFFSVLWLPMLILFVGALLSILLDASVLLIAPIAITALVLSVMRALYYGPVTTMLVLCPEKRIKEILADSRRMMKGYRGRDFALMLSFFGWSALTMVAIGLTGSLKTVVADSLLTTALLDALTGALFMPLLIYMRTASAAFYMDRMGMSSHKEPAAEPEERSRPASQTDYEAPLTQEQYDLMYGTPSRLYDDDRDNDGNRDDRDDDRRDNDDDPRDRDDSRFDRDDDRFEPIYYDDGSDDSSSDDNDDWSSDDDSDDSSGSDDD